MMTGIPAPWTRDLVLIGGGHTHALVLHRWAMAPLPGARVTVVNPDPSAPYTGMLPGHIAGHYPRAALEIDLVRLARRAGARLILDRACGIDPGARRVRLRGRPDLAYDVLSVDIGITSDLPMVPGYGAHAVSAKPLGGYARAWEEFVARATRGAVPARVVVIGGGVAGVELALAMAFRLRGVPGAQVTVLEAGAQALPHLGRAARARLLGHLRAAGIMLQTGASVVGIGADHVDLADGASVPAGLVVGAAGSRPHDWLRDTGLALQDGFITVGPTLQSVTDPRVFAVGDCAHMQHAPRAKAGVYAVRQAPVLLANLRAALAETGVQRRYWPQRDYLKLISLGDRKALADKWSLAVEGAWLWRLKDRIDAKFMQQFAPPVPAVPAASKLRAAGLDQMPGAARPLCGGCGAKMGSGALQQALAALPPPDHPEVEAGAGDDAAILRMGDRRQVIATDHLRALVDDPYTMARIAAVHALGDVWAMGAQPQAVLASITLPHMSPALQGRTLAEVMAGAHAVVAEAGGAIVGGHSAMGAEMVIGFTVTGRPEGALLTKGGARPGDALVLVKPLGTGTLLAAEMQMQAAGDDVAAALAAMAQPQGQAAAILAPRARAMTDVTGFGLAGHLMEMLVASGVAAELDLEALPLLSGAEVLAGQGHGSTIAPSNRAALEGRITAPETARAALLFDPQTAGGLLAAVPEQELATLLDALHGAGFGRAAGIGRVVAGAPGITAR